MMMREYAREDGCVSVYAGALAALGGLAPAKQAVKRRISLRGCVTEQRELASNVWGTQGGTPGVHLSSRLIVSLSLRVVALLASAVPPPCAADRRTVK